MGHSELECATPAARNADGKLQYDRKLRAMDDKKKRLQSFDQAAAESFGSSGARRGSLASTKSGGGGGNTGRQACEEEGEEVESPLKNKGTGADGHLLDSTRRKRKSDGSSFSASRRLLLI